MRELYSLGVTGAARCVLQKRQIVRFNFGEVLGLADWISITLVEAVNATVQGGQALLVFFQVLPRCVGRNDQCPRMAELDNLHNSLRAGAWEKGHCYRSGTLNAVK